MPWVCSVCRKVFCGTSNPCVLISGGIIGGHRKVHWIAWDKLCARSVEGGLGFREFRAFNQAMLAKQCWRVFTNPHSLLGRLLKAHYFPHSSFLDASLSSRPSLTWRSLLSARPLMLAEIRWRGGSSRSIKVWASPWIPRSSSFRPITPVATNDPNLLVSALIDHELGTWKHDRLRDLFLPVDVEAILKIPLGRTSQPDFAVWHYSADGRFSVRSAYHLVWSMRQVGASPSAPRSWTFLWTAKVPPKRFHSDIKFVSFLVGMARQTANLPPAPRPQVVGNAFVEQYYHILHHSPELVFRFYQDKSVLSRPDADGLMTTVTTMKVDE
ncbi:UNVERIFIED_CONTAM: putative mitochondrial protein [Sesamum radiatum]|uniref:Mitochondrial protein n=1 Tax=Sesamum radiatum TaxID=300843 RepID=A0AAW2LAG1_SESRA